MERCGPHVAISPAILRSSNNAMCREQDVPKEALLHAQLSLAALPDEQVRIYFRISLLSRSTL